MPGSSQGNNESYKYVSHSVSFKCKWMYHYLLFCGEQRTSDMGYVKPDKLNDYWDELLSQRDNYHNSIPFSGFKKTKVMLSSALQVMNESVLLSGPGLYFTMNGEMCTYTNALMNGHGGLATKRKAGVGLEAGAARDSRLTSCPQGGLHWQGIMHRPPPIAWWTCKHTVWAVREVVGPDGSCWTMICFLPHFTLMALIHVSQTV